MFSKSMLWFCIVWLAVGLVCVLMAGCATSGTVTNPPVVQNYSTSEMGSDWNKEVMAKCAIASSAVVHASKDLDPSEYDVVMDYIYQRCLIANGATI